MKTITRKDRAVIGRLLRAGHKGQALELAQSLTDASQAVQDAVRFAIIDSGYGDLDTREKRWCIEWSTLPPLPDDSKTRSVLQGAILCLRGLPGKDLPIEEQYYRHNERRRWLTTVRGRFAEAALRDLSLGRQIPLNVAGYLAVCSQTQPRHPRVRRINTVILDALCGELGWLDAYTQVPINGRAS